MNKNSISNWKEIVNALEKIGFHLFVAETSCDNEIIKNKLNNLNICLADVLQSIPDEIYNENKEVDYNIIRELVNSFDSIEKSEWLFLEHSNDDYSEIKNKCSAYLEIDCESCDRAILIDTCCFRIYVFNKNKDLIHIQYHGGFHGFLDDNHDIIPSSIAFNDWVIDNFEVCPLCDGKSGLTSRVDGEYPE